MRSEVNKAALARIEANIAARGYHLYVVSGGDQVPRYAYTIGGKNELGFDLIFAGAMHFLKSDVENIIRSTMEHLRAYKRPEAVFRIEPYGEFSTIAADASWSNGLMLGALDYYQTAKVEAVQIIPPKEARTIDVPNMHDTWSAEIEPIWQWVHKPWSYAVPENSTAVTNLSALMGEPITEVGRWEEGQWEMFAGAGSDVTDDEARVVPIGTLLAHDLSLIRAVDLQVGGALWREPTDLKWHNWKARDKH